MTEDIEEWSGHIFQTDKNAFPRLWNSGFDFDKQGNTLVNQAVGSATVSYTHLTLPTILLV